MPHTRRTLTLNIDTWDLVGTSSGGISVTSADLATSQNVANEARLFTNDAYFIQDEGIPHFVVDLGQKLTPSVLRTYLRRAALRVPDVEEVISVDIINFDPVKRVLTGDIQTRTASGVMRQQLLTYF